MLHSPQSFQCAGAGYESREECRERITGRRAVTMRAPRMTRAGTPGVMKARATLVLSILVIVSGAGSHGDRSGNHRSHAWPDRSAQSPRTERYGHSEAVLLNRSPHGLPDVCGRPGAVEAPGQRVADRSSATGWTVCCSRLPRLRTPRWTRSSRRARAFMV